MAFWLGAAIIATGGDLKGHHGSRASGDSPHTHTHHLTARTHTNRGGKSGKRGCEAVGRQALICRCGEISGSPRITVLLCTLGQAPLWCVIDGCMAEGLNNPL